MVKYQSNNRNLCLLAGRFYSISTMGSEKKGGYRIKYSHKIRCKTGLVWTTKLKLQSSTISVCQKAVYRVLLSRFLLPSRGWFQIVINDLTSLPPPGSQRLRWRPKIEINNTWNNSPYIHCVIGDTIIQDACMFEQLRFSTTSI